MLTLAITSPKGGVGKTTLALSLAGAYAHAGQRVVVQDLDPQGSALAWAAIAAANGEETPFAVCRAKSRDQKADILILDCPPGSIPPLALCADRIIVPTMPDAMSHFAVGAARKALRGRSVRLVLNRWRPDRAEHRALREAPDYAGAVVVRDRAAFASAHGRGHTIWDSGGQTAYRLAQAEIVPLLQSDGVKP